MAGMLMGIGNSPIQNLWALGMGTLGICPFGNFRGYTDFSQMGPGRSFQGAWANVLFIIFSHLPIWKFQGKCSEGISDSQALLHGQLGIVSMGHDIELKWIGPCPSLWFIHFCKFHIIIIIIIIITFCTEQIKALFRKRRFMLDKMTQGI